MARRTGVLRVLLGTVVVCQAYGLLGLAGSPAAETRPVVSLTNSRGQATNHFAPLDTVFAAFSQLRGGTRYEIRVVRSDGREISRCALTSDKAGIIPTTALWWDVGVEYSGSRVGKLDWNTLGKHTYACLLQRKTETDLKLPLEVRPIEEAGPIVYSSDGKGNPCNGFIHRKEDLCVTGRQMPPGSTLYLYAVRHRYSWNIGDRLEPVTGKPIVVQLDRGQRSFTRPIWPGDRTAIGAYDIIVKIGSPRVTWEERDLIDGGATVGFTVFKLQPWPPGPGDPPPPHVEEDLACQAPPHTSSGTVIGAPNPAYKDVFSPQEEVWVSINPRAGGHQYAGKQARVYVLEHKTQTQWEAACQNKTPLVDVSSDGYEVVTVQPGCRNVNYVKVWSNPQIREEGYDVVVDFEPFDVYDQGQDIVDKLDAKGFVVPQLWVCLDSVSFNHDPGSSTSDALTIRKNATTPVAAPEWLKAQPCQPAAYLRSKSVAIKAVFSAAAGVNSAEIRAALGTGVLGSLNKQTVLFNGGTSGSVSFAVTLPTPDAVNAFYQTWQWQYANVNNTGLPSPEAHLADSQNRLFVVLAQPLAPMAEPWADGVLGQGCTWAAGAKTEAELVAKLTDGAYCYSGKVYYGSSSHCHYNTFQLTQFLADSWADCRDMSAYFQVLCRAQGVSSAQVMRIDGPFHTKPILAIGNTTWAGTYWNFHRVGSCLNKVYDACLMLNQAAPVIPKNMDVNGNYKAGLFQSETWSPGAPSDITIVP